MHTYLLSVPGLATRDNVFGGSYRLIGSRIGDVGIHTIVIHHIAFPSRHGRAQ